MYLPKAFGILSEASDREAHGWGRRPRGVGSTPCSGLGVSRGLRGVGPTHS